MPDFIAALTAAVVFCLGLSVLNQLTDLIVPFAPFELDQNGLPQIGGALLLASFAWRFRRLAESSAALRD